MPGFANKLIACGVYSIASLIFSLTMLNFGVLIAFIAYVAVFNVVQWTVIWRYK